MSSYPCPECGAEVPSTGVSSQVGQANPVRSHTSCPECGMPLVRNVEGHDPSWQIDRDRLPADADIGGGD